MGSRRTRALFGDRSVISWMIRYSLTTSTGMPLSVIRSRCGPSVLMSAVSSCGVGVLISMRSSPRGMRFAGEGATRVNWCT